MDFASVFAPALKVVSWLIPLAILSVIIKTAWFKGLVGEAIVRFIAWIRLPGDIYHSLHNVTILTPDGTTQIDHIYVSTFGVFVVETKNMRGWIFGSEKQASWTQKIYRHTNQFQNPLRQNYKHVKALETVLEIPFDWIHSVVVFAGDSHFKTSMPDNVTRGGGFVSYIHSFTEEIMNAEQVEHIVSKIEGVRLKPSVETRHMHVEYLKSSASGDSNRKCPRCGNTMVLRTAKRGTNAGNQFWGCARFPVCKTVQPFDID